MEDFVVIRLVHSQRSGTLCGFRYFVGLERRKKVHYEKRVEMKKITNRGRAARMCGSTAEYHWDGVLEFCRNYTIARSKRILTKSRVGYAHFVSSGLVGLKIAEKNDFLLEWWSPPRNEIRSRKTDNRRA